MTFSVLIREKRNFGVAVASGSIAVGKRVPWIETGVGAVATQGLTEPSHGPRILSLLKSGVSAEKALQISLAKDENAEFRQILVLGVKGATAYTGKSCPPFCAHVVGKNFVCGGNLLAGKSVLDSMVRALHSKLPLHLRLMFSLKAGEEAGGDKRGHRSAAIRLVLEDEIFSFDVDDSPCPIDELIARLRRKFPSRAEEGARTLT